MAMPAARGLFHRAIVQSGSAVTGVPKDAATKAAEAYMTRLGLKPDQIDDLQALPAEKLLAAMRSGPGGPGPGGPGGGGGGLPLAPVIDGRSLLANPFDPTAPGMTAAVPMLIGSTETEVTWSVNTKYDPLDDAALKARVKDSLRLTDDARADQLIATYKKGRPKASNLDLALIIATDASNFRTGTDTQAERKAALGKAPVYMYRFAWYSPVNGGRIRAMHCLDIPFVFDNVDACKVVTGEGADRYVLADRMSKAWVAFARTGNPNHSGLPNWQPFDATRRATMVFNTECKAVDDPHREERLAIQSSLGVRQSL
jgi:para-nitrobenzyl esterase